MHGEHSVKRKINEQKTQNKEETDKNRDVIQIPRFAVMVSKSFGFRFRGRPFCLAVPVEVPLK
jgi:hypothetical protein